MTQFKANSNLRWQDGTTPTAREEPSRVTRKWGAQRLPIDAKATLLGVGGPVVPPPVRLTATQPIFPRPAHRSPEFGEAVAAEAARDANAARQIASPVAPQPQPPQGLYDPAMVPRIVWGPQPEEELPVEAQIREHRLSRRRKTIGGIAVVVIGLGVLAEAAVFATRPVASRAEPVPHEVSAQAAAPPVAAVPLAPVPVVPVSALPVAPPPPEAATIAPTAAPHHTVRKSAAPAAAGPTPSKAVRVHLEPRPVPIPDDPFVTAARAPATRSPAQAPAPTARAKSVDDGF